MHAFANAHSNADAAADAGRGPEALPPPERMPPLVLCVACPPPMTGQAAATTILLEGIRRQGWRHRVIDFAGPFRTGPRFFALLHRLFAVARLPFRLVAATAFLREKPIFYLQIGQGTAALLRDLPLLGHAASRGWPIVLHVHGGGFGRALERAPAPLRLLIELIVRRATKAIVLSPSLVPMFEGLLPADRIVCIDNGVDAALAEAAAASERRPGGIRGLCLLFLGNLMEEKGYGTVLEAARLDALRGARHRFVIAGARTESTTIDPADFITRHGLANLDHVGPVFGSAKHELLAAADAFVLPTRYPVEGQPIAIIEALHYGLPVITTRAGGIADMIVEGESGHFVEADDPAAILEALDRLAEQPAARAAMELNNRALARSRFTTAAHEEAMLRLFAEVQAAAVKDADVQPADVQAASGEPI